jgi:hypothetical protein
MAFMSVWFATFILMFFIPSMHEVPEFIKECQMKLLKSPRLPYPDKSWQIEMSMLFENMDSNFGPFWINTVVGIILFDLSEGWHLGLEDARDFKHEQDTLSLFSYLFNGLLVVKDAHQFVVVHPGQQVCIWVNAIYFEDSSPEISHSVCFLQFVHSDTVIIVIWYVHTRLDEITVKFLPFGKRNWKRHHEEGIEGNWDSITDTAHQGGLKLSMEEIKNNALVSIDMLIPGFKTCLFITLTFCLGLLNIGFLGLFV